MRNAKTFLLYSMSREWVTMSAAGTPAVNVEVTAPNEPSEETETLKRELAELRGKLEAFENSLTNVNEEIRQWLTQQISPLKTTLENLEATATTGMQNLVEQVDNLKADLADLSTRKLPEAPEEIIKVTEVIPPQAPPSEAPADPEKTAPQPEAPTPQKRKKNVV